MRKLFSTAVALLAVLLLSATLANVLHPEQKTRSLPVRDAAAVGSLGFADSWIWFLSPGDVNRQFDLMVETGVRSARILFPWAGIEPNPGQFDWGQADTLVNAANARGISVVALLNSTPGWATGGGRAINSPPADMATYATFVNAFASRYAGRVGAYEVWNEPNAVLFWAGPKGPDPAGFANMLKAAYPAIKSADPGATVVAGGLAPTINFFSITTNPVQFLEGMYAAGAGGSFDAMAYHPYLFTPRAEARFSTAGPNSSRGLLDGIRGVMNANGDGGKQIWATEFGASTTDVDEATQAERIRDFIVTWRGLPGTGPAFVYTTRDRNTGSPNDQDNYGVYRTDFTPKLAAEAIRSVA